MKRTRRRPYEQPRIRSEKLLYPAFAQNCDKCPNISLRTIGTSCQLGQYRLY